MKQKALNTITEIINCGLRKINSYNSIVRENQLLKEEIEYLKKHANICNLAPATGFIRKSQLDVLNFTCEFFDFIKELELRPFLDGGSLIGAIRHSGFIPWDDDIDFCLMREDCDKLIDFCLKNCHVEIYNGSIKDYSAKRHYQRMNELMRRYPNEYVLDIWVDQLQINKGTSCVDRLSIDFWPQDYYADDYPIEDFLKYLDMLADEKKRIGNVKKVVEFLKNERENNHWISKKATGIIGPGIDNVSGYKRTKTAKEWLKTQDIFPLRNLPFESTQFYAPNKPEILANWQYPNYMAFPSDTIHSSHEEIKRRSIIGVVPTVEFYLIDAFEIYHFLELYRLFEKNGIYASFIAEKPDINTTRTWFDYDNSIKILDNLRVRYFNHCNPNCDFAFTTQNAECLSKYRNKKIHLQYGVGLTQYSYCESNESIDGFDIKLVNGTHSFDIVRKKDKKIKIFKIGYPKYYNRNDADYIDGEISLTNLIEEKNRERKTVLFYFPTWGEHSSIQAYSNVFRELKKDYFIVSKIHHCTYRLESEKKHLDAISEISDIILPGNYSFEKAADTAQIAICDAKSGAATEVPLIHPDVKLILLYAKDPKLNLYKDLIKDFAFCAKEPKDLPKLLHSIRHEDSFINKRKTIINSFYSKIDDSELLNFIHYLKENKSND